MPRARGGSGRVKLEEVARLAGVSTATVSRTFNEPDKVSESVRRRVLDAAASLNWIPNAAGRALASSRTHIAGAIIPTLDNEIFARQVNGMQTVFAERDFTLFVGCFNYDPVEGLDQVQAMLARGVEALAIVGEDHAPELFEMLQRRRVPYVLLYSYRPDCPHLCVGFDNRAAFRTIAAYLLALNHRRFAAIFQPTGNNDRVKARLAGLHEVLAEAGVEIQPSDVRIGPSTVGFGAESFRTIMRPQERLQPTAIVCGNDNLALGALAAAAELGLSAPRDFSITGFDDLAISSILSPPLTTMRIDNQKIGYLAAQLLLNAIDGHEGAESVELLPELKIRQSTGPPPA